MSDRTVHARNETMEVARYDRSGKWYLEPVGRLGDFTGFPPRRRLTVREAARYALDWCFVFQGLPGGQTFDRLVARLDGANGPAREGER